MKILKWTGFIFGGLIVLFFVFYFVVLSISNSRLNQNYEVNIENLDIPLDSSSIANGKHIAETRGCLDCHGANLGGKVFMDNPAMGRLISPNLTNGAGGIARDYSNVDWIRSIRYGIRKDGKPLLIMPSEDYYYLSDEDLKHLLAYIKSAPAVDNELPENSFGIVARLLIATGELQLAPEKIDFNEQRNEMPTREVSLEYGKYLSYNCISCHGRNFSGGKIHGADPSWPAAANLTPDKDTGLGDWTEEDFFNALRKGIRKDKTTLHPAMPEAFKNFTDEEIKAIWLYLKNLSPMKIEEN